MLTLPIQCSRMVSIVVKALLLVHFLQLIAEVACQSCHGYIKNDWDAANNKTIAKIKIQPSPHEVHFRLSVRMSIPIQLPTKYVGQLELIRSAEDIIRDLNLGKKLKYKLYFPVRQPIPSITGLWFNNQQLCSGPPAIGTFVTTIILNHTMQISKPELEAETNLPLSSNFSNKNTLTNDLKNDLNCGRRTAIKTINPLIFRGEKISVGQWPWLVALFVTEINITFICAGSLVTNRHVITAAHCLIKDQTSRPPETFLVALGRHRLKDWTEKHSLTREISKYIIHPDYKLGENADSDLAVLTLREKVEFDSHIRPICLWTEQPQLRYVVGMSGSVAGWGKSENAELTIEPRLSKSLIVSQKDCRNKHELFKLLVTNRTFCAGSDDESGPCNGDSGSGFMLYKKSTDRYYLRGIVSVSLADTICDLKDYVIYVDVAKYFKWIKIQISTIE